MCYDRGITEPMKFRGQSKITAGSAVANVLGDFTLTPPVRYIDTRDKEAINAI